MTEIEILRNQTNEEARKAVTVSIPAVIRAIDSIIEDSCFFQVSLKEVENTSNNDFASFSPSPNTELQNSAPCPTVFHTNNHLVQAHDVFVREVTALFPILSSLKLWIAFHSPPAEDGNNTGVEVQLTVFRLVDRLLSNITPCLHNVENYYEVRGELVKKCLKNPNHSGFRLSLQEHDRVAYINAREKLTDFRHQCLIVLDTIAKEHKSILIPKGETEDGMEML